METLVICRPNVDRQNAKKKKKKKKNGEEMFMIPGMINFV